MTYGGGLEQAGAVPKWVQGQLEKRRGFNEISGLMRRQGEDQMMHELKSCPGTLSDQGLKGPSSAAWSLT